MPGCLPMCVCTTEHFSIREFALPNCNGDLRDYLCIEEHLGVLKSDLVMNKDQIRTKVETAYTMQMAKSECRDRFAVDLSR